MESKIHTHVPYVRVQCDWETFLRPNPQQQCVSQTSSSTSTDSDDVDTVSPITPLPSTTEFWLSSGIIDKDGNSSEVDCSVCVNQTTPCENDLVVSVSLKDTTHSNVLAAQKVDKMHDSKSDSDLYWTRDWLESKVPIPTQSTAAATVSTMTTTANTASTASANPDQAQERDKAIIVKQHYPLSAKNDKFDVTILSAHRMHVACSTTGADAMIYAPAQSLSTLHGRTPHPIFDIDFSPEPLVERSSHLCVSCSTDGSVRAWDSTTGQLCRDMEGHVGDVNVSRFFPSGQVVLTGGADTVLRLWYLNLTDATVDKPHSGACVATLKGHQGAVFDAAMIGRGRQLYSTSRDGTMRLWDVSTQAAVHTYEPNKGALFDAPPVNTCTLLHNSTSTDVDESKIVCIAGLSNGAVVQVDPRTDAVIPLVRFTSHSAINTVATYASNRVYLGDDSGVLRVLDTRKMSHTLLSFQRSDAAIRHICAVSPVLLWCANNDGEVCLWDIDRKHIASELSGSDCDQVYKLAMSPTGSTVVTAGEDGTARVFRDVR
jgi:proteasomal ATPase-associated factor 1